MDPMFENRRSPTQTEGEGSGPRAKRLGPQAWRRRSPGATQASGAARKAGPARRLSPAAARRAGRSRSRCGRAGAGAQGRRGARPVGATLETPRVAPTLRRSRASTLGVGSRRRYRASLSSKGAKTPSLRMQVWPWDSNRGRSRLLTASISW